MSTSSPARMLAIYGGTTFLVYIETNGFVKSSPAFLLALPVIGLSLLTLITTMSAEPRFKTSASFAILALSRYLLAAQSSWTSMICGYLMMCAANILYCHSFSSQIRYWSRELIAAATAYLLVLFYHCFSDLLVSIPSLVLLLSVTLITSCVIIVGAGSVCQYGQVMDCDTEQASYVRLIGAVANTASTSLFVMNLFTERTEKIKVVSRVLFYFGQSLLFLANERTF